MRINLLHNQIVIDTVTDKFIESVNKNLVSKLEERFPRADEVILYEDYLSEGFLSGGSFLCPLTVLENGARSLVFVSWRVDAKRFRSAVPYSYIGSELLDFSFPENVPAEFSARVAERLYIDRENAISLKVEASVPDKTMLSGKYSQSFIDMLAVALTEQIEREFSIRGAKDSTLELSLPFAPASYMEHTKDNVTYRRIGISARACTVRDLWVRWTRTDGGSYSVSSHPKEGTIIFEIPDEVPENVREKEYRYLIQKESQAAYKNAMSRKNFVEWRELVKRVIKRGEVEEIPQNEAPVSQIQPSDDKAQSLFAPDEVKETQALNLDNMFNIPEDTDEEDINPDITALLRNIIGASPKGEAEPEEEFKFSGLTVSAPLEEDIDEEPSKLDESSDAATEAEPEEEPSAEETSEEEPCEEEPAEENPEEEEVLKAEEIPEEEEVLEEELPEEDEEALLELARLDGDEDEPPFDVDEAVKEYTVEEPEEKATEAAAEEIPISETAEEKSEEPELGIPKRFFEFDYDKERDEEKERLLRELEELKSELALSRAESEEKSRECERLRRGMSDMVLADEQLRRELVRLRASEEAAKRAEDRERERTAELARQAIEEQKLREADVDIEAEREAERLAEEERLREKERLEAEKREAERLEAERIALEESVRAEEAAKAQERESLSLPDKPENYISKTADMIFSHAVDPNITKKIQEIIVEAVEYFGKSDVYMKIKARVHDTFTVRLEFIEFPESEYTLVTDIIRVLGHSKIGIVKVLLD